MRRPILLVLLAVLALAAAPPAVAQRERRSSTVTIRAADILRDPAAVTERLRARGLRVRAFVDWATPDAVGTIVDVRSQRVLVCDCGGSPHDPYDEAAAHREELRRLRTVAVSRDSVRLPADYPYDLQVIAGRAGAEPRYDTHGPLPVHGPGITFTPFSPLEVLRGR